MNGCLRNKFILLGVPVHYSQCGYVDSFQRTKPFINRRSHNFWQKVEIKMTKVEALNIVQPMFITGEAITPEQIAGLLKEPEATKLLQSIGVLYSKYTNGRVGFYPTNATNKAGGEVLDENDVVLWTKSKYSSNVQVSGETFYVLKEAEEDFAVILNDQNKDVGYIKPLQDSRSPWVRFENDQRPFYMGLVNKAKPHLKNGTMRFLDEWVRTNYGATTSLKYHGMISMKAFYDAIIPDIMKVVLGKEVIPVTPGRISRIEYMKLMEMDAVNGEITGIMDDNIHIEVNHESGSDLFEVFVEGTSVGGFSFTKKEGFEKTRQSEWTWAKMKDGKPDLNGLDYRKVVNYVHELLCLDQKPNPKVKKEENFMSDTMSDAFKKAKRIKKYGYGKKVKV